MTSGCGPWQFSSASPTRHSWPEALPAISPIGPLEHPAGGDAVEAELGEVGLGGSAVQDPAGELGADGGGDLEAVAAAATGVEIAGDVGARTREGIPVRR